MDIFIMIKELYRIFPKQRRGKIIRFVSIDFCARFLRISVPKMLQYIRSNREKRTWNTYFLKVLMPPLQSERKDGAREKYMKRGRVQEIRKETKKEKDTRLHWRVLEASGRVAFDVHRMMSGSTRRGGTANMKKKKERLSMDTVEAASSP